MRFDRRKIQRNQGTIPIIGGCLDAGVIEVSENGPFCDTEKSNNAVLKNNQHNLEQFSRPRSD